MAGNDTRIRWEAQDLEKATPASPPRPDRRNSLTSVNSTRRRASIDPTVALPIQYRTLSLQIQDGNSEHAVKTATNKDAAANELASLDWHLIPVDEVYTRLSTSRNQGLSVAQATAKLIEFGKNRPSDPPTHYTKQIFGYFFKGFGSILFVGAVLVFISWKPLGEPNPSLANLALAIVLVAVFIIQAAFNAWQDWSSSRVMQSITTMLPDNCVALRDGTRVSIAALDIVPGDVLIVKAGNKLPADVRFVEISSDAKFDRSIITGESVPVSGTIENTNTNFLETSCIGLQGTHCISGTAVGVVIGTGDKTVFGRIAKLTNEPKTAFTPLEKDVFNFVLIIFCLMTSMITLCVIVWATYVRKRFPDWIDVPTLIVDCVGIAIAFIPEGLPIAVASSLTITANVMRKNKILCKSLKTVETLGAVSVICSDKTGTLTKNEMTVTEAAVGLFSMSSEAARDEIVRQRDANNGAIALEQLRAISGLCNAAEFDAKTATLPLSDRKILGDATDQAILRFSEHLGSVSELKACWVKNFELAFNSKNKFMIRTVTLADKMGLNLALSSDEASQFQQDDMLLTIKGAPDVLISRCTTFVDRDGSRKTLDNQMRSSVSLTKDQWSSQGKRVILLARKLVAKTDVHSNPRDARFEKDVMSWASTGLTLVGMVGIVDPPRDDIPTMVRILRGAHIRFLMVTGDFALTAQAIAVECGIITSPAHAIKSVSDLSRDNASSDSTAEIKAKGSHQFSSIILSGSELLTLNDNQWSQVCQYDEIVFARTTPEQKLRIVREFQARHEVVAMTGDGVNDAPSLKAADIGIALGSGSDIAIEAADMVLLDSFSAVLEAVKYGRVVFDNLRKTVAYLLPAGSFSEFWPGFTNIIFGLPQVLSSFLQIIICVFTDAAASITLTYEAPEADVMTRPPRRPGKDRLVDWRLIAQTYGFIGVIETFTSFAMSYWYLGRQGIPFSALWFQYGALPADLDPDFVAARLNVASSIYFVNLVVMQWFSLMAIRTRRLSIFQHPPIFNPMTQNLKLFGGILFALVFVFFWLYIPAFQTVFGNAPVPVEHFFLPMAFGLCVLFLDESRKYAVRRWPSGLFARIAW